jgi:hypothetical protein
MDVNGKPRGPAATGGPAALILVVDDDSDSLALLPSSVRIVLRIASMSAVFAMLQSYGLGLLSGNSVPLPP